MNEEQRVGSFRIKEVECYAGELGFYPCLCHKGPVWHVGQVTSSNLFTSGSNFGLLVFGCSVGDSGDKVCRSVEYTQLWLKSGAVHEHKVLSKVKTSQAGYTLRWMLLTILALVSMHRCKVEITPPPNVPSALWGWSHYVCEALRYNGECAIKMPLKKVVILFSV